MMEILNIIVHEVKKYTSKEITDTSNDKKEASQDKVTYDFRPNENDIDEFSVMLSEELTKLFSKTGLSTGKFNEPKDDDEKKPQFVTLVEKYYKNKIFENFIQFSKSATREFGNQLSHSGTSKGGYLWFNHYTVNKESFLSIVLLRKKNGISIDSNLNINKIERLDLSKLHMAARINLTKWKSKKSSRYIAFRIGEKAKDVTDYFSKFIGCEEYTKAKADTKNLITVTKKYALIHKFDEIQTEDIKLLVFKTCTEWKNKDIPVKLDSISDLLDTTYQIPEKNKGEFLNIAQSDPYMLSNEIQIDTRELRNLKRYSCRTSKMSISFDSDLLDKEIIFDNTKNELIFTKLPPSLLSELQDRKLEIKNETTNP